MYELNSAEEKAAIETLKNALRDAALKSKKASRGGREDVWVSIAHPLFEKYEIRFFWALPSFYCREPGEYIEIVNKVTRERFYQTFGGGLPGISQAVIRGQLNP